MEGWDRRFPRRELVLCVQQKTTRWSWRLLYQRLLSGLHAQGTACVPLCSHVQMCVHTWPEIGLYSSGLQFTDLPFWTWILNFKKKSHFLQECVGNNSGNALKPLRYTSAVFQTSVQRTCALFSLTVLPIGNFLFPVFVNDRYLF